MVRKLPGGVTAAYVPHGPDVGKYGNNPEFVEELGKKIAQILPVKPAFIRFDLPWIIETGKMDRIFAGSELKKAAVDIQPPDTVIVSLKESEDEILRRMKSKTRYNIRLSVKKGVEIHTGAGNCFPYGMICTGKQPQETKLQSIPGNTITRFLIFRNPAG